MIITTTRVMNMIRITITISITMPPLIITLLVITTPKYLTGLVPFAAGCVLPCHVEEKTIDLTLLFIHNR